MNLTDSTMFMVQSSRQMRDGMTSKTKKCIKYVEERMNLKKLKIKRALI